MGKKKLDNKNICAVIQATYKSYSYPGRSIVIIEGKTILAHIVSRIRKIKSVSDIVLATSNDPTDVPLAEEAQKLNIRVVRGHAKDVVSRLCKAVKEFEGDTILKVNGHYPLIDPYLAEELIEEHIRGGYEYSYNEHFYGTIYGTGCEVVQKNLLFDLKKKDLTVEQKEAGTLHFHQSERYKVLRLPYKNPRPHYKVCFVFEKDLRLIEYIFRNLKHPYTDEITALMDSNPILVESVISEPIKEVGLEKLYLFPEKLEALIKRNFQRPDGKYPISVELSLTNRCNFSCIWCSDKELRLRSQGDDIGLEVLQRLLIDLRRGGTKGIVIEGGGEPTIYPYFDEVVNSAYALGFGIGLITNGSRHLKKQTIDKLEWLRVSLDASTPDEYKRLKDSDSFEKVMSNIKSFCLSKTTVGIGYVVTSQNIGSLESLLLRLSRFGVNYIQFRPVIDHPELESDVNLSYLQRYQTDNFSVIIDGMNQNVVEGNAGLPCIAHSLTTVIAADGDVYLCGRLNIHQWIKAIGNINQKGFEQIWNGAERQRQAKVALDSNFCAKYCPRCRMTKFNQLFVNISKIKTKNFI